MADTIFAQATAPGRAGVAIIRISGPQAVAAAERLGAGRLSPRRASLQRLVDPEDGTLIDEAILVHFSARASFTGEDVIEIQCHGSPAVIRRLLHLLGRMPGLRIAVPGEFTRRALEYGRLDLAQVEGLADLLAAETEAQRRQAVALAEGRLSARVANWRQQLIECLALVEAVIDFGEDVPDNVLRTVPERLVGILSDLRESLSGARASERIRSGFIVAICGAPNVGKSTLLNYIAGREIAITSDIAGTTRDVLEVQMEIGGLAVTFLDTAGLRDATDSIERLGIERALQRADAADLRIFLTEDRLYPVYEKHVQDGDLVVRAKADTGADFNDLAVSGLTGAGVGDLLDRISDVLSKRVTGASGLAHARQQEAVSRASSRVEKVLKLLDDPIGDIEFAAEELREAVAALDQLTGRVDVEAVLDVVFRSFCLGK